MYQPQKRYVSVVKVGMVCN